MTIFKDNLNIIILLCIFLIVNACNKTNPKVIVEDKNSIKLLEVQNKTIVENKYSSEKVLKKKLNITESITSNKINDNDVVFEFKNERMLQGRDKKNQKTNKALTAVFKMFKQNLSLGSTNLNLNNNEITRVIDYSNKSFNTENLVQYKNILVFLPFTGPYSNFALKIRKSLDMTILRFGSNNVQIVYFDTGTKNYALNLERLLENVDPHLIIGPFTREALLKIKPFVISKSIPMFTFSNDIALIEKIFGLLDFLLKSRLIVFFHVLLKKVTKNSV